MVPKASVLVSWHGQGPRDPTLRAMTPGRQDKDKVRGCPPRPVTGQSSPILQLPPCLEATGRTGPEGNQRGERRGQKEAGWVAGHLRG